MDMRQLVRETFTGVALEPMLEAVARMEAEDAMYRRNVIIARVKNLIVEYFVEDEEEYDFVDEENEDRELRDLVGDLLNLSEESELLNDVQIISHPTYFEFKINFVDGTNEYTRFNFIDLDFIIGNENDNETHNWMEEGF